jgi:hypothetical protein
MAGRPAGSRRQPVFGPLSLSGEKWLALTAAGGRACRCDRAGPGCRCEGPGHLARLTAARGPRTGRPVHCFRHRPELFSASADYRDA